MSAKADEILEDRLPVRREVADAIVVQVEPLGRDPEDRDRVEDFALQDVLIEALRHRLLAGRKAGVVDFGSVLDESRNEPGTTELVVGVGAEHERPLTPEQHGLDGTR